MDIAQIIQPLLVLSHLIVETLSYVSFVLSNTFEIEFIASIGTLQEKYYTSLALPFGKFRSPRLTVEKSIGHNKAQVMERLSDNFYGEVTTGPVICPKTHDKGLR